MPLDHGQQEQHDIFGLVPVLSVQDDCIALPVQNQVTATARTLAYAQTGAGKPHGIGTATGALDDAELLDISASYLASGLGAMSTKSAGL